MVMKMKGRSSLDISDAESEAKFDASACHSLVGGVAPICLSPLSLSLSLSDVCVCVCVCVCVLHQNLCPRASILIFRTVEA